jgi:hypothetical protein
MTMLATIREKAHAVALSLKHHWLVLIAFVATLAPALPDIFTQLQAVDYQNLSLKGVAISVGLILLRTVVLKLLTVAA